MKKLDVTDVTQFAFSPDRKTLVVGTSKGLISLWDVKTWRERSSFGRGINISTLSFSANGQTLAVGYGDGRVRVFDLAGEKEVFSAFTGRDGQTPGAASSAGEGVRELVLAPDGKALISSCSVGSPSKNPRIWLHGPYKLWHVPTGRVTAFKPTAELVRGAVFTADGKKFLTLTREPGDRAMDKVRAWDTASGRPLATRPFAGPVRLLANSPAGNVAAVDWEKQDAKYQPTDRTITVWDVDTGNEMMVLKIPRSRVAAVRFSPDGKILASYSENGDVLLWDLSKPADQAPLTLPGPQRLGVYPELTFAADGRSLAAWSGRREITVWWVVKKEQ